MCASWLALLSDRYQCWSLKWCGKVSPSSCFIDNMRFADRLLRKSGGTMTPVIFAQFRIASLILLLILSAACSSVSCGQSRHVPLGPAALHGFGQVYFVPIGTFPSDVVKRLAVYYREKYGLPIAVLSAPRQEIVAQAFNEKRGTVCC